MPTFHEQMPYWYGWIAWAVLLAIPVGLVGFFWIKRWQHLASRLLQLPPALVELTKPGVVQQRLTEVNCREVLKTATQFARSSLERAGAADANGALRQFAEHEQSANLLRELCLEALHDGQTRSLSLSFDGDAVYLLVIPGRHEHPHLLRRYDSLAQGWLEHCRWLRDAMLPEQTSGHIHHLLIFLHQDARDGVCLYGCEGNPTRLAPQMILDDRERQQTDWQQITDAQDLNLAAKS